MKTGQKVQLAGNKTKQDVIVADSTGNAIVTLWQDHVDTMQQGKSYHLKNFFVKEYAGKKYLSMSKDDCSLEEIEDWQCQDCKE